MNLTSIDELVMTNENEEKMTISNKCNCGNSARYKCPRCKVISCSLECVQQHKRIKLCNGKPYTPADKYIKIQEMTDEEFTKDYLFIENMRRTVKDSSMVLNRKHELKKNNKSFNNDYNYNTEGFMLYDDLKKAISNSSIDLLIKKKSNSNSRLKNRRNLKKECLKRDIDLFLEPNGFTTSTRNTSICSKGIIYWRIEYIFPTFIHNDKIEYVYVEKRFNENDLLKDNLEMVLKKSHNIEFLNLKSKEYKIEDISIFILKNPNSDIRCSMEKVTFKGYSLSEFLSKNNLSILEFPVFYIVPNSQITEFLNIYQNDILLFDSDSSDSSSSSGSESDNEDLGNK